MLRQILKFALIASGVVIALIVGLMAFTLLFPPTYEAVAELPGSSSSVVVELEPMHLYLAEYRRTLVLRSPSTADARTNMFPDTGGYSRAQLYSLSDGRFLMKGYFDAFELDPKRHTIRPLKAPNTTDGQYLGAFDDTGDGRWRFIPASELPESDLSPPIGSTSNPALQGIPASGRP